MVIPWYFNFFVSWQQCEEKTIVTYEDLNQDVVGTMSGICKQLGINVSLDEIERAIAQTSTIETRRNRMVVGRGEGLPQTCKSRIIEMASFYKDTDFSKIGIVS